MNEMESQNEVWTGVLGQDYGDVYARTGVFPTGVADGLLGVLNNAITQAAQVATVRATFAGADGRTYTTPVYGQPLQQPGLMGLDVGALVPILLIGAVVYLVATR